MDAQRQLLDQLMGIDRNRLADEKPSKQYRWYDSSVCEFFNVKFCPHDLFINTKSDLGPCEKIHDEKLKAEFQSKSRREKRPYELRFVRFLQNLLDDVERKIKTKQSQGRLDLPIPKTTEQRERNRENQSKIKTLTDQINELLNQMEKLGETGRVAESHSLMKRVELLQTQKSILLREHERENPEEKKLQVCETCGGFQVVNDLSEVRVKRHYEGKQHRGYEQIRETLKEFKKKREDERGETQKDRRDSRERDGRRKDRSKDRSAQSHMHGRAEDIDGRRDDIGKSKTRSASGEQSGRRRRSRSRSRSRSPAKSSRVKDGVSNTASTRNPVDGHDRRSGSRRSKRSRSKSPGFRHKSGRRSPRSSRRY